MLQLNAQNLLILKTLNEALEAHSKGTPLALDRIVSDFDYTTFHVSNAADNRSTLWVSIKTKAWQSVEKCRSTSLNLAQYLESKYMSFPGVSVASAPEPGYDYSLQVDLNSLHQESIAQLSLLKMMILSYPFQLAFDEFEQLSKLPVPEDGTSIDSKTLHTINYRDDETFFIKPSNDRITVIFETLFQDETDKILGKVFLQEFVDARKRNRTIQSAPQVLVSNEPPLELQPHLTSAQQNKDAYKRFVTFVLFPRHFTTQELQFSTVSQLCLFRNYFHYHIKCSKAYMHSRMRYRVDSFVKVLNRAKLDEEDDAESEKEPTTRRTITGRKMVY